MRERLRALREQSGVVPKAPVPDWGAAQLASQPVSVGSQSTQISTPSVRTVGGVGEIRERLDRMRSARRRSVVSARPMDDAALAASLGGEPLAPGLVRVESRLAAGHRHGHAPIERKTLVGAVDHLIPNAPSNPDELVFIDTETSGLAGGTGTVVFLLGLGRFEGDELVLVQYLLTRFSGEAAMLAHARGWLGEPAALVSFNGKTFDLPLIATRHRLCALSDPFAGRAHVDLLYPVRRLFAGRWPDCRLSTVEKRLLGLVRQDDLSGAEAPQAWFDWLRQGVPGRLPGVIEHNRLDLISLAALIPYVRACYDDPVAWDADPLALVKSALHESAERDAYRYLSANRYRLEDEASLALARLARRAGDYALAVDIWRELAGIDHPEALEHLAKYHEHVERNLPRALAVTRRLLDLEPDEARHLHRCSRIQRKHDGEAGRGDHEDPSPRADYPSP